VNLPAVTRNQRARMKTRQKLVDAAFRIMAKKGIDVATINEITEEADVGFGSFYNYFKSKEEIAREVFIERSAQMGSEFDILNQGVDDPALKLSRNIIRMAERTRKDPVWGWFLIHANFALQDVRNVFWKRMVGNLTTGLETGRYKIGSVTTVGDVIFGGIFAILRAILEGNASATAEIELVEAVLRILGVSHDEAASVARMPLPESVSPD